MGRRRYFGVVQALDVGQHDHRAELHGQRRQAMLDGMFKFIGFKALLRRHGGVRQPAGALHGFVILADWLEWDGRAPLASADLVVAGIGHRPQQPGAERPAPVAVQRAKGGDERFLSRVGGQVIIAKDAHGSVKDTVLIGKDQRIESIQVTLLGSANQGGLVHERNFIRAESGLGGADRQACLLCYTNSNLGSDISGRLSLTCPGQTSHVKQQHTVIGPERIALITGGSSGIGLAVARLLAQRGSHVWIGARGQERLTAALAEVEAARQSDRQVIGATRVDVSDPAQAAVMVEAVAAKIGVPDLVVNSAGVARPGYFHKVDLEDFHWQMDINYFGTVNTVRAVLPGMIARGSGHIVNISSVAGFLGVFGYSAYGASKFAVAGLSEVLRAEMKPRGISVSVVFPPDVDTPQLAYESPFRPAETRGITDLGAVVPPENIAAAILRGVSSGHAVIVPDVTDRALYRLTRLLGNMTYRVMDWLAVRAAKRAGAN
jgi:3-dehydrosphinganine reductase